MSSFVLGTFRGLPLTVPKWAPVVHAGLGFTLSVLGGIQGYKINRQEFPLSPTKERIKEFAPKLLKNIALITSSFVVLGGIGSIGIELVANSLSSKISARPVIRAIGLGTKNAAHVIHPIVSFFGLTILRNSWKASS